MTISEVVRPGATPSILQIFFGLLSPATTQHTPPMTGDYIDLAPFKAARKAAKATAGVAAQAKNDNKYLKKRSRGTEAQSSEKRLKPNDDGE